METVQRGGALAIRRSNLLDLASFASGGLLPLLIPVCFHYGLLAISSIETGLACSDDGDGGGGCAATGEGSYYLLNLICMLLALLSVGCHLYEKLSSIRARGERDLAVACESENTRTLYSLVLHASCIMNVLHRLVLSDCLWLQ